jgi:hypothetical protein
MITTSSTPPLFVDAIEAALPPSAIATFPAASDAAPMAAMRKSWRRLGASGWLFGITFDASSFFILLFPFKQGQNN